MFYSMYRNSASTSFYPVLTVLFVRFLFVVVAYAGESSKGEKRQQLGFRPVHFAAVGLPLGDIASNGGDQKTGAFKIDDGNVVGMCCS